MRRKGLELLPWTPELRQWQARVALLRQLDLDAQVESQWPDVSDATLLQTLEHWLMPYLGKVSRLSHFANLDLSSIVHNLLPWPMPQRLDEQAPPIIAVVGYENPSMLQLVLAVALLNWSITVGRLLWRRLVTSKALRAA